MKVYTFPVGAVVLDIDAPTGMTEYWDGEPRAVELVAGARRLAMQLSTKWRLGQFWVYRTLSGAHVVFERLLPSLGDALEVLLDANEQEGWRECGGHMAHCAGGQLTLRTGRKERLVYGGMRPFDIYPLDVVDDLSPIHVLEHHEEVCDAVAEKHSL